LSKAASEVRIREERDAMAITTPQDIHPSSAAAGIDLQEVARKKFEEIGSILRLVLLEAAEKLSAGH